MKTVMRQNMRCARSDLNCASVFCTWVHAKGAKDTIIDQVQTTPNTVAMVFVVIRRCFTGNTMQYKYFSEVATRM